jgi:UDP-N-acetylglucosamine 4,6-dehydratase
MGKTVLLTGGTGSFGTAFIDAVLQRDDPHSVRVFSRDELKQSEVQRRFADDDRLRFLIGDVRDLPRLVLACRGVDVIIHAAAMKQVPACEYNPFEAVQTNVIGAENVVTAAIENDVPLTLALSTDKAVNRQSLRRHKARRREDHRAGKRVRRGLSVALRGCAIRQRGRQSWVRGAALQGSGRDRPPHDHRRADDSLWITLDQAVGFVLDALDRTGGGEIFVPRIPSIRVTDLAEAIAPHAELKTIGIRPGEKVHELLVTEDESRHSYETSTGFLILPEHASWELKTGDGSALPPGFRFSSGDNDWWLTVEELREMSGDVTASLT